MKVFFLFENFEIESQFRKRKKKKKEKIFFVS